MSSEIIIVEIISHFSFNLGTGKGSAAPRVFTPLGVPPVVSLATLDAEKIDACPALIKSDWKGGWRHVPRYGVMGREGGIQARLEPWTVCGLAQGNIWTGVGMAVKESWADGLAVKKSWAVGLAA